MADGKQEMLPDSTQGETPKEEKKLSKGSKRKQQRSSKDGRKKKRMAKKKKTGSKSLGKMSQGSDADSEIDLSKELKPLGSYLHDREEMINQAFKAIRGDQLQVLIPDILKNLPIDELKLLCMNQLEGLSRKRIKHIIDGTEMQSSSDSDESGTDAATRATGQATGGEVVTEAAAQTTGVEGESKMEVAENRDVETSVDSTVQPAGGGVMDQGGEEKEEEEVKEDIDGVPVELDVDIDGFIIHNVQGVRHEKHNMVDDGDRKKDGDRSRKDYRRKRNSGGCTGRRSDRVSSTHHCNLSRSPSPRRLSRRRYSSPGSNRSSKSSSSRSYSRNHSGSRSRSRSGSRFRRRRRSRSRSWSRSNRSGGSSRSTSPRRLLPQDLSSRSPSPLVFSEPVEAIQMCYPTPPTPTGSLSSGEIRDILDLADDEEAEEDEEEEDDDGEEEEDVTDHVEGYGEMRNKQVDKEPHTAGENRDDIVNDDVVNDNIDNKGDNNDDPFKVTVKECGTHNDTTNDTTIMTQSLDKTNTNNLKSIGCDANVNSSEKYGDSNDANQNANESDDTDETPDDTDSDDVDTVSDDDIDLNLLDLGIDISQLNDRPQQYSAAHASPSGSLPVEPNLVDQEMKAEETELEVLELELRARAIRSLMKKCLKEDEKS